LLLTWSGSGEELIYYLILLLLNTPGKPSRFRRSLPIMAQGRAEGASEISPLGSASLLKTKSKPVPAQRLSGGRFFHAPSHLGGVEHFPLHSFIFCTSFHERSKKTEAIAFCCATRECDALSRAMFYSNGKHESSGISPMPALKLFLVNRPLSSKFWRHFENRGFSP
jgi:hypothetical protein